MLCSNLLVKNLITTGLYCACEFKIRLFHDLDLLGWGYNLLQVGNNKCGLWTQNPISTICFSTVFTEIKKEVNVCVLGDNLKLILRDVEYCEIINYSQVDSFISLSQDMLPSWYASYDNLQWRQRPITW